MSDMECLIDLYRRVNSRVSVPFVVISVTIFVVTLTILGG